MKRVLLAAAFALGSAVLVGCSSSEPTAPAGGAAPPKDSGAGTEVGGKKSPRIPPVKK